MDRSKPASSGSSSEDLERARSLSQRLLGGAAVAAPAAHPYVSFGAAPPPAPASHAAPIAPPLTQPAPASHAPPLPPAAPTSHAAPVAPPIPPAAPASHATPVAPPLPPAAPTSHAAPVAPPIPPAAPVAAPVATFASPAPARPSLPLLSRREPLRAPATGFGPLAWNRLLDGCAATVAADAAFIMDPHGLVVASRGPRSHEEVEAVGARLMVAFEQADHIEGGTVTLSLTVESPRGSLHGLRLKLPDGSHLTLGLLVPGGLTGERQARLVALVAASGAPA